jgi:hypothetical protein
MLMLYIDLASGIYVKYMWFLDEKIIYFARLQGQGGNPIYRQGQRGVHPAPFIQTLAGSWGILETAGGAELGKSPVWLSLPASLAFTQKLL